MKSEAMQAATYLDGPPPPLLSIGTVVTYGSGSWSNRILSDSKILSVAVQPIKIQAWLGAVHSWASSLAEIVSSSSLPAFARRDRPTLGGSFFSSDLI